PSWTTCGCSRGTPAGGKTSCATRSRKARGSSSTRSRRTPPPTSQRTCGAKCSCVSRTPSASSPTTPPTSPPIDPPHHEIPCIRTQKCVRMHGICRLGDLTWVSCSVRRGMDVTEGTTVLVTGASSGIGAALAPMLAERGATVGVVARREDRLREVLSRCQGDGHRYWSCDLGDPVAAERVAIEAWDAFGHLDVIVHNAAIPKRRTIQDLTVSELEQVMAVNFFAPARMTMAVLPRMLERDAGVIVNVSSLGGRLGIIHESVYCASKFALCGWSESLAIDLWDTGVDVRLIIPGPIDTEIWDLPDND